jgi:hypothetical protein
MKIKNIFFVMLACVISFSKSVFSSTAEPEEVTLEMLRSFDWDSLPNASEEYQELWQQVLADVGVRDCGTPVKQGISGGCYCRFFDGKFRIGINQELLKSPQPSIVEFVFYRLAISSMAIDLNVLKILVPWARKIIIMQGTLAALDYCLRAGKDNAVNGLIKTVLGLIVRKKQASMCFLGPTNEELLTYSFKFILAHREGKKPDYNVWAQKYMTELLTGDKQFRCILIYKKNRFSGDYEPTLIDLVDDDFVIYIPQAREQNEPLRAVSVFFKNRSFGCHVCTDTALEDDDFVVDYSQNVTPDQLPEDMTPEEAFAKLHLWIFGS